MQRTDTAAPAGPLPKPADEEPIANAPAPGSDAVAAIDSQQLLRGRREVEILHLGMRYRLQATKAGKLILTK